MGTLDQQPGLARARTAGWSAVLLAQLTLIAPSRAAPPPTDAESSDPAVTEPAATDPTATEPQTAAQWYARGIELATAGRLDAAAEAFLRSYALKPTPEALFNAALAYQNADAPVAAIETYQRVLAEPAVDANLRQAAIEAIERLRGQVGTLKGLRYAPTRPPVELYVSGRRVALDELPLLVMPGRIVVEVVDAQGERAQESYEIAAGEALVIDVRALLPGPIEPPPPELEDPGPGATEDPGLATRDTRLRRAEQLRLSTWIGLGLAGGASVSAATLAGLAARERRAYLAATCLEFDGGVCPDGFEPGDPAANQRAFEAYRTGAIVSAALAGGFAITSLTVGLLSRRIARQAQPGSAARRPARVAPELGGLVLRF